LSFIETSALDSTNVETAFHNILTGTPTSRIPPGCLLFKAIVELVLSRLVNWPHVNWL